MEKNEFGEKKGIIKPFIIDLESTNGTHVNGVTIPPARYYELKLNDREYMVCFGDCLTPASHKVRDVFERVCTAARRGCMIDI